MAHTTSESVYINRMLTVFINPLEDDSDIITAGKDDLWMCDLINVVKLKNGTMVTSTVSHFSYAPLFKAPHLFTKLLESNILYDNLLIDILSV